jgi:hypothetical protein
MTATGGVEYQNAAASIAARRFKTTTSCMWFGSREPGLHWAMSQWR